MVDRSPTAVAAVWHQRRSIGPASALRMRSAVALPCAEIASSRSWHAPAAFHVLRRALQSFSFHLCPDPFGSQEVAILLGRQRATVSAADGDGRRIDTRGGARAPCDAPPDGVSATVPVQ